MPNQMNIRQDGRLGHIELNRPKALNALSLEMVTAIREQLESWRHDDSIITILFTGAGEKAFCAGTDVKQVALAKQTSPQIPNVDCEVKEARHRTEHHAAPEPPTRQLKTIESPNSILSQTLGARGNLGADLFRAEYALDALIHEYPKSVASYLDGITMGGGVGIALAGNYQIATTRTKLAMPEVAIGFFPDAGATHFLGQQGTAGLLMALTGCVIDGQTCQRLGFATHFGPSAQTQRLVSLLSELPVEKAMETFCTGTQIPAQANTFLELADSISRDIASPPHETLNSLRRSLAKHAKDDGRPPLREVATDLQKRLRNHCPTSQLVAIEQFRRGRELSFREALRMEYRISQHCLARDNFYEGIRATLIDKDQKPKWKPPQPEGVTRQDIDSHFSELGEFELTFAD